MEIWHIWSLIALGFLFVELFDTGFGMICMTLGAGVSALLSGVWQIGLTGQLLGFILGSGLAFVSIRPIVLHWLCSRRNREGTRTNADALIGKVGRVTETIVPENRTGRIQIDGDHWQAISFNRETIPVGTMVTVIRRESILLTVKPTQSCSSTSF